MKRGQFLILFTPRPASSGDTRDGSDNPACPSPDARRSTPPSSSSPPASAPPKPPSLNPPWAEFSDQLPATAPAPTPRRPPSRAVPLHINIKNRPFFLFPSQAIGHCPCKPWMNVAGVPVSESGDGCAREILVTSSSRLFVGTPSSNPVARMARLQNPQRRCYLARYPQ